MIVELERAAASLWVAPEVARLGSWLLRSAEGFTGRANSALPLGDPGVPLPEAVAVVSRWYSARGLPPMIVVPAALDGESGALDAYLAGRGWTIRPGAAYVMTAPADSVKNVAGARVRIDPTPDEAWCALYHYRGTTLPPIARTLLMSAPWQAFASVRPESGAESGTESGAAAVAVGRVAVAGDWAAVTAVETDPAWRRRGLAATITAALCREAAARGASRVLLQVETDNAPAQALYARCGFTLSHRYHYRVAPGTR